MKAKIGIALVALLVLGVASVGFAAVETEGGDIINGFKETCQEFFANLSEDEREQIEEARADFSAQKEELRQSFLEEMPDEVREFAEQKMEARDGRHGKMNGNGCGGYHFEE